MPTQFPDSHLTSTECSDIQLEIMRGFSKNPLYQSVCNSYTSHNDWWEFSRQSINRSTNVMTQLGYFSTIAGGHKSYDSLFFTLLSVPAAFKPFDVWALIMVFIHAEIKFLAACSTPNNEASLTATLITLINMFSDNIQSKYEKHLAITDALLNLSKLELQVQNREKGVGGDFAFILEWKTADNRLCIVPIIFQAKRVLDEKVDLSQKVKSTDEYQYETLKKSKCNPAYIFYNCDTQGVLKYPRLPTVKNVKDINISDNKYETSCIDNCLSLSIYIMNLLCRDDIYIAESRKEALADLLPEAQENELHEIITFSVDPSAAEEYRREYGLYLESIKNKNTEDNVKKPRPKF